MNKDNKKQARLETVKRAVAMREFRQQRGLPITKGRLSRENKKLFERQYGNLQSDDSDSDDTAAADDMSEVDIDDLPFANRFPVPINNNNKNNTLVNEKKMSHEEEQEEKRKQELRDWYNAPTNTNNNPADVDEMFELFMPEEEDTHPKQKEIPLNQNNINSSNKITTAVEITEELLRKRERMIEMSRHLTMEQFLMFGLKPASAKAYLGYQKQVTSTKIHNQNRNYEWNYDDILIYITDPDVMKKKNNSTMSYIISAFKFLSRVARKPLDKSQEDFIQMLLKSRSQMIPDIQRQVGPITKERLRELQEFYVRLRDQDIGRSVIIPRFSAADCQELTEATTMLYGCALRVFQMRSLTINSFNFTKDGKGWVTVPAKSKIKINGTKMIEMKQIHPEFVGRIKEMVERRSLNNNNNNNNYGRLFCSKWDNGKEYDKMLRKLSEAASIIFDWPQGLSWDGTHNFRHGGAADAFEEGGLQLVMLRTGHESEAIALHYARTDLQRLDKSKNLSQKGVYSLSDEQAQQWWNSKLKLNGDILEKQGIFQRREINESMYALNARGIQVEELRWIDDLNERLECPDLDVRAILEKHAHDVGVPRAQSQLQNNNNNNNDLNHHHHHLNHQHQQLQFMNNNNPGTFPLRREREEEEKQVKMEKISESYSRAIQQHKPFAIHFKHHLEVPEGYRRFTIVIGKEKHQLITRTDGDKRIRDDEINLLRFHMFLDMNCIRRKEYFEFPQRYNTE